MVSYLIEKGANQNIVDNTYRELPIHYLAKSCGSSNRDMFENVAALSENLDTLNSFGETPLQVACQYSKNTRAVYYLINKGADFNREDQWGFTPLDKAAEW